MHNGRGEVAGSRCLELQSGAHISKHKQDAENKSQSLPLVTHFSHVSFFNPSQKEPPTVDQLFKFQRLVGGLTHQISTADVQRQAGHGVIALYQQQCRQGKETSPVCGIHVRCKKAKGNMMYLAVKVFASLGIRSEEWLRSGHQKFHLAHFELTMSVTQLNMM